MRPLVALSLTGSHVVLDGEQRVSVPVHAAAWRGGVAEALALSRAREPKARFDVAALLGFEHARVALMTIDQPGGLTSIPAANHEKLVQAWCAETLHLLPPEQVIRWRALADPRKVLVSCVMRSLAQALEAACRDAGARLASCRPAVMTAMETPHRDTVLIWTEDAEIGARHAVVQLLRFGDRRLTGVWRGWLPDDEELEAMASRFESETGGTVAATRFRQHWPRVIA
jgi:hypothetical protein